LGSVRRTFNTAATPLGIVTYDPWGTPESGMVPTFGFTGELQDATTGLVNLRARWYSTNQGKFTSVDPFAGDAETPYSFHPYQYGFSDPVLLTDASGRCSRTADDYCFPESDRPSGGGVPVVPPPGVGVDGPPVPNPFPNVPPPGPMTMPEVPPAVPAAASEAAPSVITGIARFCLGVFTLVAATFALTCSGPCDPPTQTKTGTKSYEVIVELGAGDYQNAIGMKAQHPSAHVIATNLVSEWHIGEQLDRIGMNSPQDQRTYPQLRMYLGWKEAKQKGVDVGITQPYENQDVSSGIADFVYSIAPYPSQASIFGVQAARIAKTQSGTMVAVTGGISIGRFEMGFNSVRPGSKFIGVPGTPYGVPHKDWESGPFSTLIHIVP